MKDWRKGQSDKKSPPDTHPKGFKILLLLYKITSQVSDSHALSLQQHDLHP